MKFLTPVCLILLSLPGLALAEVPRIDNGSEPVEGLQKLELTELWRAGGLDEEILLGSVSDVIADSDGNTYVLDTRLCEVKVFDAGGELAATLGREGDGPGELRQPIDIILLPDDVLGVALGFPGKLVLLNMDGTPAGQLHPAADPTEGGFSIMQDIAFHDGTLVCCAGVMDFGEDGGGSQNRYMVACDLDCSNSVRFLEKSLPLHFAARKYVEADDYYVSGRWALAPDGLVYAAASRDEYLLSVYDRSGALVRTIAREYEPRRRTEAEKDEVGRGMRIVMDGEEIQFERFIEDHDQCIERMVCAPDGTLRIMTPQGHLNQPEDILECWDVFTLDGKFIRQIAVPRPEGVVTGRAYFIGTDRLVIVRGDNDDGPEDDEEEFDEEDIEALEVICYKID